MDKKDDLQELLQARARADEELEKRRTPMTILFSDIKGSTTYAEKKGDLEYLQMINRYYDMLFPVIEAESGRVVKTIGDAILALFDDPVGAVKAAAGMQRTLAKDREGKEEIEQIRIRVGLHYGLGLIKDNDVFGDVVNAASRVQHQAETEQILITDALLGAAKTAGFQCAKIGRAELKGKDEPIDLYAVAWSESATEQLIEEVQARFEKRLKEKEKQREQVEEELDNARELWRTERRNLNAEIERLEESIERVREQMSKDLQSELQFQLDESVRVREQLEQELLAARQKLEAEQNNFRAQITGMQASVVDAMERSNNPARMAMAVREQVEARVSESKAEWQLQWDGDRRRLTAEIERLKKASGVAEEKKEAARRVLLEKLGKVPASSSAPAVKSAAQWERDFQDAAIQWDTEREHLKLKITKLETEMQRTQDSIRTEIFQEMQAQYEPKLAEANHERMRLERDIQAFRSELAGERERLRARIQHLEKSIPEAQEAARKQASAELQSDFDIQIEEANRMRSRSERKHQDLVEELESERRRTKKQMAALEEQLKEAKEAAYKKK